MRDPSDPWAGTDEPDAQTRAAWQIANCGMCDDDGYQGVHVCDHIDHTAAARRGMAAVRAAMGWDKRPSP